MHGPPLAIVIHTMGGTLEGTDSWFITSAHQSQVSAHYGVSQDGRVHQYVALDNTAWANGILERGNRWPFSKVINPNQLTISIETEGHANDTPISATMSVTVHDLCTLAIRQYPSITHIIGHSVISPRSRPRCPGERWHDKMRDIATWHNLTLVV